MKLIGGIVITIVGVIVAGVVTGVCMLWWTTADIVKGLRR